MVTDRDAQIERITATVKSGEIESFVPPPRQLRRRGPRYPGVKELFGAALDPTAVARYEETNDSRLHSLRAEAEHAHQEAVTRSDTQAAAGLQSANDAVRAHERTEVLHTPFLIWSGPDFFVDATTAYNNSTAKFRLHYQEDGVAWVIFYFFWENTRDLPVKVKLAGELIPKGFVSAAADGGIFGGGKSEVLMQGQILPLRWWEHPPTAPDLIPTSSAQEIADVDADCTDWGSLAETISASINTPVTCVWPGIAVPGHGALVIEMFFTMYYGVSDSDSGDVDMDFKSGGFGVTCPAVLVEIVPD